MNIPFKRNFLILLLLGAALALRLYAIGSTAEFLGDQGRDGLAIIGAIEERKIVATGPTVGAGYYTGPFYYYLMAPAYLLFPNSPIAPIIEMCLISVAAVALFLYVASQLFGFQVAYIVSILWAISPLMLLQDRRLWNPTPIPVFILLLIASLIWVFKQKKYWGYITAAFAVSVLLQLHYVNAISILFIGLVWLLAETNVMKQKQKNKPYLWMIGAALLFVASIGPFLWYESQHAYVDIVGSLSTFMHGQDQVFSKRAYVVSLIKVIASLWKYVSALNSQGILIGIAVFMVFVNGIRKIFETRVLVLWFCFGVSVLALYKDTMQPQYWYQLIPVVFLLFTGALSGIHKKMVVIVSILAVVLASYISWTLIHPYKVDDPDLPRITQIVKKVSTLMEGQTFAFTVMHSRSFNDLHIRYFFRLYGITSVSIDDPSNKTLIIICENGCLEKPIENKIRIMCSTEVCPLDTATVPFDVWKYEKTERVGNSALYLYSR